MRLGKKGPFELSAVMGEDFSQYVIPSRLIKQPKLLHSEQAYKKAVCLVPTEKYGLVGEMLFSCPPPVQIHTARAGNWLPIPQPSQRSHGCLCKGRTQFVSHRPLDLEMSSFLINASFVRIYMAPGFIQKLIFNSISHYYKFPKARFT